MYFTNRSVFDQIAQNMINKGLPGVVRLRAKGVPVTVWLGAIKIAIYGGVDIDQVWIGFI